MKLINLYAGPGAGKSTTAAGLFYSMKLAGLKVELITEYAKELSYDARYRTLENQFYVFGKQYERLCRVRDQVDFAITDGPLLHSIIYGKPSVAFHNLVMEAYESFDNHDVYIKRVKDYFPYGRSQTEEEAKDLDDDVLDMLKTLGISFISVEGDAFAVQRIITELST